MTDTYDNNDGEDLVPRSQIRALEEKARKAGELETELAELKRRGAFSEAGINPADPKTKYFVKGYDGELTPEAIRAEAEAAGLFAPPPTEQRQQTQDSPTPQEMAAHARMAAASEGSAGNKPIDLIEAFGPRGSKKPDEIMSMVRAAGRRTAEDQQ